MTGWKPSKGHGQGRRRAAAERAGKRPDRRKADRTLQRTVRLLLVGYVLLLLGIILALWQGERLDDNRAMDAADGRAALGREVDRAVAAENREQDARLDVATQERVRSCEQDELARRASLQLLLGAGVPPALVPRYFRTDRDCRAEAARYAARIRATQTTP